MGMFDEVIMNFKCPICKEKNKIGFQTKQGPNALFRYKVGDKFKFKEKEEKFIDAIGNCHSDKCKIAAAKNCLKEHGYVSGFGRSIHVKINLDEKKRITDKVDILRVDDYSADDESWIKSLDVEGLFRYETFFDITQSEDVSLLLMHKFTGDFFLDRVAKLRELGLEQDEIRSVFHSNDYTKIKEVLK